MRLSDAGLRRHPTKLIYPNHRLPPGLTEDATRDRSNRLLDVAADLDISNAVRDTKSPLNHTHQWIIGRQLVLAK